MRRSGNFAILLAFPAVFLSTPCNIFSIADDSTVQGEVGQFYGAFGLNSDGETHFNGVCNAFLGRVPAEDQAEVLSSMVHRALTATPMDRSVIADVILFLQNLGRNIVWNQDLSDVIWNLGRHEDQYIRIDAIGLLVLRSDSISRQIIISALNDPVEGVRYRALVGMTAWSDAIPVFQKFILDHQSDPAYGRSIEPVTYVLHGLQNKRTTQDYVNHFYGIFNAPQDDVPMMMYPFGRDVPLSAQSEVLDRILDRALSAKPNEGFVAIENVLDYRNALASKIPFSDHFEIDIQILATDSNYLVRSDLIYFLSLAKRSKDIGLILSALSDPKAEVRSSAISAIYRRDDARSIFKNYIETHGNDPAYKVPVQSVRNADAQFYDNPQDINSSTRTPSK